VRTVVGVVLVVLVLAPLAAVAVRGLRRTTWASGAADVGRTTVQTVAEGLIVLAALVIGVVIVVALVD
jgi:hypothetical protein